MRGRFTVGAVTMFGTLMVAGCSHSYPYRVTDEGCNCEEYTREDEIAQLSYHFVAQYSVGNRIATDIQVTIGNRGADTLDASSAFIKVTSRNVPYEYNDRYISVGIRRIMPGEHRTLTLQGEYVLADGENPWLRIAGELLTLSLEGFTMGDRHISRQEVRFIPNNPFLTQ